MLASPGMISHWVNMIGTPITGVWQLTRPQITKYKEIQGAIPPYLYATFGAYAGEYAMMGKTDNNFINRFGYLERVINTPIMTYMYWQLGKINGYTRPLWQIIVPAILAVVFSYLAEFGGVLPQIRREIWTGLSILAVILVLLQVREIEKLVSPLNKAGSFAWYLYILLPLYQLIPYIPSEEAYLTILHILDFVSRIIYVINLQIILEAN